MSISKKSLCILSCILVGISVFFPYISVSFFGASMSKSLIDGSDGIIIIIIAVIALICSACEKYIPSIINGILAFLIFVLENANVSSNLGEGNELARSMLQNGAGYYMLLIGSIALVFFSIIGLKDRKKINSSTNYQPTNNIQSESNE